MPLQDVIWGQADMLSGAGGWGGAGLLGLVLAWLLLRYLPEADRRAERERAVLLAEISKKDEQLKDVVAQLLGSNAANLEKAAVETRAALDRVIAHCNRELTFNGELIQRDLASLTDAIDDLTAKLRPSGDKTRRRRSAVPPPGPETTSITISAPPPS